MKAFLYTTTVLALSSAAAHAQTPPPTTAPLVVIPLPTQKELDDALSLVQTTNLWKKTFAWKETGSTTETVVAHARTMLGDNAPTIEIRGKDESLSTFVLPEATLGSVLCSLAELTDRRVWVFPGRLVLASEDALTETERAALKSKNAGVWTQESGWIADSNLEDLTITVVDADLKQRLTAKGQTAPLPLPATPLPRGTDFASYTLPFGELSPASQKALQDLVNNSRYNFSGPVAIPPDELVCLDMSQERFESLFLKDLGTGKQLRGYFRWSMARSRSTPTP